MLTIRSRWCRWLFGSCHAARNFTHALLVFADLGAKNGFTPDECGAMQCALGFACSTAENVRESLSRALEAPQKNQVSRSYSSFGHAKRLGKMAAVKGRCP